jgi:hypothetical protein
MHIQVGGVGVVVTLFISGKEGRATLLSLSTGWLTTTLVASLLCVHIFVVWALDVCGVF